MNTAKAKELINIFWKEWYNTPSANQEKSIDDFLATPQAAAILSGDGLDANWKENFKEWYYATEEERADIVSAEQCVEWIEKNIIGLSGEDWKEDGVPLSKQVEIMKGRIIINMNYGNQSNAAEIAGLNGAISILKKYETEPYKIN